MKKAILILVTVAMLAGILTSCSDQLCPAYSYNNESEQVENMN